MPTNTEEFKVRTKLFQRLPLLLFCVSLPCLMGASRTTPKEGLSISSMVKLSDLVFAGEVVGMEFVFREDLPPQFTTDITVEVEEMIKGRPNAGANRVKFMIRGGEGIHPTTGETLICIATGAPEFEIGEKVLIFLLKHKRLIEHRRLRGLSPPPHEGMAPVWWGNRKIVDEKVSVPYTFKERLFDNGQWRDRTRVRNIRLPIDLAKQMVKAALKNAEAISVIEERLRAFAKESPWVQDGPIPDQAFLDSVKSEIRPILNQEQMEKK